MINVNATQTETVIEAAAQTGQTDIVNYLFEHGSEANPRYENKTPLALALENKQTDPAGILRSYGGIECIEGYRPEKV